MHGHRDAAATCGCCPARRRTDRRTPTAGIVDGPCVAGGPPLGSIAVTDTRASTAPAVPRDDLSASIKAYDIRGVVGEQLDARAGPRDRRGAGPAAARGGRRRPASSSSATTCATVVARAGRGVRRGRHRAGPRRRRHRAGQHRHALLRLRRPRRARRDVHRQPQPRQVQRDQALPGGRGARSAQDTGLATIREAVEAGVPAPGRAAAPVTSRARHARRLRRLPARPGRPVGVRPLRVVVDAGNGMGGYTVPAVLGGAAAGRRADVLRARRHLPQPRGQPARPGEPGRPAEGAWSPRAPTSGWPSTATPTAASSSTSAASR